MEITNIHVTNSASALILNKVIFYELMQIFLRFMLSSLGEFLAGGLVCGWVLEKFYWCTDINKTVHIVIYVYNFNNMREEQKCKTGNG